MFTSAWTAQTLFPTRVISMEIHFKCNCMHSSGQMFQVVRKVAQNMLFDRLMRNNKLSLPYTSLSCSDKALCINIDSSKLLNNIMPFCQLKVNETGCKKEVACYVIVVNDHLIGFVKFITWLVHAHTSTCDGFSDRNALHLPMKK